MAGDDEMSLDVYLTIEGYKQNRDRILIRCEGSTTEVDYKTFKQLFPDKEPVYTEVPDNEVFSDNITHNLNNMAREAGVYTCLWRPEEVGIEYAAQLIVPLSNGLTSLKMTPEYYQQFNPENGWGDYGGLVDFAQRYLNACMVYPDAKVSVWR